MKNVTQNVSKNVIAISMLVLLSACTADVSAPKFPGSSATTPTPNADQAFNHKVDGPELDGQWVSECLEGIFGEESKRISLTFKKQNVTKMVENFNDGYCEQAGKVENYKGKYRFKSRDQGDVYELDYRFDLGNGITSLTGERVRLENDTLYISDFMIGEGVEPQTALLKQ